MIEESLNFGMNAVQLSKVSSLQSHVSELDKSLQLVLDNLDSMHQDQLEAHEEEYQRKEIEYQKQQIILKLRESIFNLKTNMEDIYNSNKLTRENKYLQFRDICQSSAIQTLNPNYFDTFIDKDYVISTKKYLFTTRDKLFDNLSDDKKSIIKTLDNKEKQLEEIVSLNIQKPSLPREPFLNKKRLKNGQRPIKPKDYYKISIERKRKDSTYEKDKTNDTYYPPYAIFGIFVVTLLSLIPMSIIESIFADEKSGVIENDFFIFLMVSPVFIFLLYYMWYLYKLSNQYKMRKKFYEYEKALSKYLRYEESTKKLLKEYEAKLQNYKENNKTILQKYQSELDQYETYQSDILNLKQEIVSNYQLFND